VSSPRWDAHLHLNAGSWCAPSKTPQLTHGHTLPCQDQVLKELSAIPRRCDLAANLRFAAASIVEQHNDVLHLWLQGGPKSEAGLVTIVVGVLQDLLTGTMDPETASDVCAAAAAVLANVINMAGHVDAAHAPGSGMVSKRLVTDQVVNMNVLRAIVEIGMLAPSAVIPLPPGHRIHIELSTAASRAPRGEQSWTPLRVCGHLLAEMIALAVGDDGAGVTTDGFKLVVGKLAKVRVLQDLLEAALEDPGSGERSYRLVVGSVPHLVAQMHAATQC
jgi:hypothetical protein